MFIPLQVCFLMMAGSYSNNFDRKQTQNRTDEMLSGLGAVFTALRVSWLGRSNSAPLWRHSAFKAKCRHVSLHTAKPRPVRSDLNWEEYCTEGPPELGGRETTEALQKQRKVAGPADSASLWEVKGEHKEWALAERGFTGNGIILFF